MSVNVGRSEPAPPPIAWVEISSLGSRAYRLRAAGSRAVLEVGAGAAGEGLTSIFSWSDVLDFGRALVEYAEQELAS